MGFSYGNKIKITVFGQSHSEKMGVVVENLPSGFEIDREKLQKFMARRAPGNDSLSTARKEADEIIFASGLVKGKTCGAPVCMIIENTNTRSQDYANLRDIPRPSHADYAAWLKFGNSRDADGGGQFSGRLTAPVCAAGGVLIQLLKERGIRIGAHIASIGNIKDDMFDPCGVTEKDFVSNKAFPVLNDAAGEKMAELITEAKKRGDSVGGIVECAVCNMPGGLGDAMFGGIESRISAAVFGIPAVKGIEFGSGFRGAEMYGSQNNDTFSADGEKVVTVTNNHGGILGGISSGMPIIFRAAFKPTPSIAIKQKSISLAEMKNTELEIKGRHDPCIVKRGAVCVEAAAAIAVSDIIFE